MLKRNFRLSKDRDISNTFLRGRSFFNRNLTIKYHKDQKQIRFAFVVSTKVSKLAVRRNQMKRVLRDEIRKHIELLPKGDYVIMVKPLAKNLDNNELRYSLKLLLEKSKLI